jgi:outer membrane protein OmpA-like peptidoglycan-associated protein
MTRLQFYAWYLGTMCLADFASLISMGIHTLFYIKEFKMKTMSTFKKSVLSIVILSAVTGSFISWEKYQPRQETPSMIEFYQNQNRDFDQSEILLESMVSNDSDKLAQLAEDNLLLEAELIAQEIAESSYSPEADEAHDEAFEDEKLTMWEEEEESIQATIQATSDAQLSELEVTNKVLFAFDSSKVEADYFPLLNKTAQLMQNESIGETQVWQVVGYADLSGNYIYNSKLAKKRAQAVSEYLVNKGVDEKQLMIVSLGASQPVSSERNIENNRLDRRVEIHDYQAEVAVLSEQFNDRLAREVIKLKKKQIVAIQTDPIETDVVEQSAPLETILLINFVQEKRQGLVTVMEL